jgi:hypothetical protein
VLHIHLYRARKRYRDLVAAIADEAGRRLPDAGRIGELKALRDAARERAAEIELEMTMGEAAPA